MSRVVFILVLCLASVGLADPPGGAPYKLFGQAVVLKTAAPAYAYSVPFVAQYYDGTGSYISNVGGVEIGLQSDGDGTWSVVLPDGFSSVVPVEEIVFYGFSALGHSYVFEGVDYGVGVLEGPTLYEFVKGFAEGFFWVFMLWLAVGLVGMFRRFAWVTSS